MQNMEKKAIEMRVSLFLYSIEPDVAQILPQRPRLHYFCLTDF